MEVGQPLLKWIKADTLHPAHIAQGGDLIEVSADGFELLYGLWQLVDHDDPVIQRRVDYKFRGRAVRFLALLMIDAFSWGVIRMLNRSLFICPRSFRFPGVWGSAPLPASGVQPDAMLAPPGGRVFSVHPGHVLSIKNPEL